MKEKNVVITGYVDQTYSVIKENVIKQGGIIKESVTSKTDYLICNVEGGLFVAMAPAIRAYKHATGVDLAEYGVGDVMIGGMK